MKRISFTVETSGWHFYDDRRRWVYDLTDPEITEDAWKEGRVITYVDAAGYFETPDQFDPLPVGSYRRLPFRYFERASDITIGHVEVERLQVAFGIWVDPSSTAMHRSVIGRCLAAILSMWRYHLRRHHHVHDVLFLRILALTPFDKRPTKDHDLRIDVYAPDEAMP